MSTTELLRNKVVQTEWGMINFSEVRVRIHNILTVPKYSMQKRAEKTRVRF